MFHTMTLTKRATKDLVLSFRVTPEIAGRLKQLAAREERTVGDTLRRLLLKALKRAA